MTFLKTDRVTVVIDGVLITSNRTKNPQYLLDPTALVGWSDGVEMRREAVQRANSHGDFVEPGKLSSRLITITGTAAASSAGELQAMRDIFTSILNDGSHDRMSVETESGKRFATVSLGGQPNWIRKNDTTAVWKLDLYAPDPRLYGPSRYAQITSAGTLGAGLSFPITYAMSFGVESEKQNVILRNIGNTASWPTFVIQGDYPSGFKIRNYDGRELVFTGPTFMSTPVVLDSALGSAVQAGTDKSYLLSKREWFPIPAESAIQPHFIPFQEGDGWMDVLYADAWI